MTEKKVTEKPDSELSEAEKQVQSLKRVLTVKELKFVELYLGGYSAVNAFGESGLSIAEVPSKRAAEKLLQAPKIRLYIDALHRTVASRSALHLETLDQKLADIVMTDILDCVIIGAPYEDLKGVSRTHVTIKHPSELTAAQRASITSLKSIDGGLELKTADKLKAIEMLIKRRGGFTDTHNVNVSGAEVRVIAMPGDNGRGPKSGD